MGFFKLYNTTVTVLVPVNLVTGVLDWENAVVFNKYNKLIVKGQG
jgi:hypothetical protein